LEAELYNSAASYAVYSDDSTWQLRMCKIAEDDWDSKIALAWRAADPYCQQRDKEAVAAIAAAAITPTPLARIDTELVGGSWRSDAHDMQQRSRFVNKIAQAFDETPSALVMESARQLEASLYSSACSYQPYSDESTWVSRLQQAIELNAKRRAATGAITRVVASTSAGRTLSSDASTNGAKPILIEILAAAAVEEEAAVLSSTDGTTGSHCAGAATSTAREAADSTLACTTAVAGSSAPTSASTAVVAESHTGAQVVLEQPHSLKQLPAAVHTHTDSSTTTSSSDIRNAISSSSSSSSTNAPESDVATALLQQQQQQRLLAAESRANAAAQRVAAAAAAATAVLSQVMAQQILSDTHAVLEATTAAAAAVDSASAALKEQAAALQELHAQLVTQQQFMNRDTKHAVTATSVGFVESVESDSDDDCPPLAYANLHSTTDVLSDTAAVSAPMATVAAKNNSSSSTSSSSLRHTADDAAQK
jgi:trimeric autotransporter adhesin